MKKLILLLMAAVFAAAVLAPSPAVAQEKTEKKAAAAKEARWHGTLVRMNTDKSSMTVVRNRVDKRIYFDSSTKWTKGTKVIEASEIKEGADVICLGQYDEKGEFHATRIDLREPK